MSATVCSGSVIAGSDGASTPTPVPSICASDVGATAPADHNALRRSMPKQPNAPAVAIASVCARLNPARRATSAIEEYGAPAASRSASVSPIERTDDRIRRRTSRSGGTEGGMSTGEVLRVRAAMKPISTVPRALDTIDVATGEAAKAINQRSDVCAVPAAGVVAEAMVALVLADAMAEKFGGDSVTEMARNLDGYLSAMAVR